ncbi:hypothetical protein Fleli_2241 [Bernardetia litoralis DSM 6794]|uniref:RHS repeat-associated core domain protein n=1 Tax=Bernardetia litoralis (strain ATCC 23117 / DSM 6794 / NBRC 15988 / NCIMB 1366 / Fx l1 / Sio-4) TaxID=880071 RepID=I4AKY3_BERLS|nr:hypothetical protein [Bernardetia litoralis]AFM04618.1 hypothetical protein Fleli_2241 [Bernardetia litoralis DSM 6794]
MFGDSSFVLMTEKEKEGKHSLKIENKNIAKIELDLYLGRMRIFDDRGILIKENFLNTDDFARFLSIDRFASKYPSNSPYGYAANNPVFYVDVNGDSLGFHDTHQDLVNDFESLIVGNFNQHVKVLKSQDGSFIGLEKVANKEAGKYFAAEDGVNQDAFDILHSHLKEGKMTVQLINEQNEDNTKVIFGSFTDQIFDISDFAVVGGRTDRINTRSSIIHEVTEQYAKQVLNMNEYKDAHQYGYNQEVSTYSGGFVPDIDRTDEGGYYERLIEKNGKYSFTDKMRYNFKYEYVNKGNELGKKLIGVEYVDEK